MSNPQLLTAGPLKQEKKTDFCIRIFFHDERNLEIDLPQRVVLTPMHAEFVLKINKRSFFESLFLAKIIKRSDFSH